MRVLLWHVHGSWTTALVQGDHEYVVPVLPGRDPDGRGRAQTWDWPASVVEATPEELGDTELDAVILQRPHELRDLCEAWTGRRPGRDLPAVYVEHNAPQGRIAEMVHPVGPDDDVLVSHVTAFNDLLWDCRGARTQVIEHGVIDPGPLFTGELPRAAVVINEARRRGRVTGTDLLEGFAADGVPIDLFGMDATALGGIDDLPQAVLHTEIARRRVYLHPYRWTSLGLALIEAMHLGMPVLALGTTGAAEAIPPAAGCVSTRPAQLAAAGRAFLADPEKATRAGAAARAHALERFGLERFLTDWDRTLMEVAAGAHRAGLRAR